MEKYQREMCTLVQRSGATVALFAPNRVRSLWREWSLLHFALAWVEANKEHVRWFVAWTEKRPELLVEARQAGKTRVRPAPPPRRIERPSPGAPVSAQEKIPLLMERIEGQSGAWQRLTGLKPREFQRQLEIFVAVWEDQNRSQTVRGRHRQKNGRGGRKGADFGPREMFFFILFYHRHYPMQKTVAALFGLTQQWASLWIKHLTPIAETALSRKFAPPLRKPATLEQLLAVEPLVLLIAEPDHLTPEQRATLEQLTRLRASLP